MTSFNWSLLRLIIFSVLFVSETGNLLAQGTFPSMVTIPGGAFMMGTERGQADEQPVHLVEIRSFLLAEH